MKLLMGMIAAAAFTFTGQAYASNMPAGLALAQKSGCMGCHKIDTKLVGPGFKEVSAKYKGDKKAEAMLVAKVTKGGSGVWGKMPMPPNPSVKPADMKTIVSWILKQ